MTAPAAHDAPAAPDRSWAARNYGALKVAVILMSALIVLGLIVIFATIVNRMSAGPSAADAPPLAVPVPADVAALLGADAEVVSTALDGSRLAIVLKRPDGHAVIVVDLRSGRVLNVIGGEAAPR